MADDPSDLDVNTVPIEASTNEEEMILVTHTREGRKRSLERRSDEENNSEEEWHQVRGKKVPTRKNVTKKQDEVNQTDDNSDREVIITNEQQLPKQFALARTLKENNVTGISSIKYINPFKIKMIFETECDAVALISNRHIINKGWRMHKKSEVGFSYGVIKDVDIELTDEEIKDNITCMDAELISIRRLNRRDRDKDEWVPCESVRLCFKGSYLPHTIQVHGVRVYVEPYKFPVSQCTICWRLGHSVKTCKMRKVKCPKCAGDHANCDTNIFKCINCSGAHMALTKTCPAFIKEKRIRLIMAEHNVTYDKALPMYTEIIADEPEVIPSVSTSLRDFPPILSQNINSNANETGRSYGDAVKSSAAAIQLQPDKSPIMQQHVKQPKKKTKSERIMQWDGPSMDEESVPDPTEEPPHREKDITSFSELCSRIKEVVFMQKLSVQSKIMRVCEVFVEWISTVAAGLVSDWPILKFVFGSFIDNCSQP